MLVVKELIQDLESNFRQYYAILNQIVQTIPGENPPAIKELLYSLSNIQDEVVDYRLKKILKEEHPYIPQIQVEKFSEKSFQQSCSLDQLAQNFLTQRRELLKMLYTLPRESWNRTGVHEKEGHISFKELIRRMVEKDQEVLSKLNQVVVEK
jgi:hypothetical protein